MTSYMEFKIIVMAKSCSLDPCPWSFANENDGGIIFNEKNELQKTVKSFFPTENIYTTFSNNWS